MNRDFIFSLAVKAGMQESDVADAEVLDIFERFAELLTESNIAAIRKESANPYYKDCGDVVYGMDKAADFLSGTLSLES